MNLTPELQRWADAWKNEAEYNDNFHNALAVFVDMDPELKAHRDFVEKEGYGFGDRAFHAVWQRLVEQMPANFSFLEIGVFKGQVLSLVAMLAKRYAKVANITGVTTLTNTPDTRCRYPEGDYLNWIHGIYKQFNVPFDHTKLILGRSSDVHVLNHLRPQEFDMVYVDGGHDYADVSSDIQNFAPRTKVGGFLIMDDSSNFLNIGSCWPGLEQVSQAVKARLESDERFRHLFACGHLRVFQRVKE